MADIKFMTITDFSNDRKNNYEQHYFNDGIHEYCSFEMWNALMSSQTVGNESFRFHYWNPWKCIEINEHSFDHFFFCCKESMILD